MNLWNSTLDRIAIRATEKDKSRRYESPADLRAEIARFLANQPVLATPPSPIYLASKFIRRHRFGTMVTAILLCTSVAFASLLSRSRHRQAQANQRHEQALQFVSELLTVPPAIAGRTHDMTGPDYVRRVRRMVTSRFDSDPESQGFVLYALGNLLLNLGLFDDAESILQNSFDCRARTLGVNHLDTLRSFDRLAVACFLQGKYHDAERMHRQIMSQRRRLLGAEHPDTLMSMNNLAIALERLGRLQDSESLLTEAVSTLDNRSADSAEALLLKNNLADIYAKTGRLAEAEKLHLAVLASRQRTLGMTDPDTLRTMNDIAVLYVREGRYREAENLHHELKTTA